MDKLEPNKKLDIHEILKDLENYVPRRTEWVWRDTNHTKYGQFDFKDMSAPLKNSVPLMGAEYIDGIDPQPAPVITTEIASGRFEDDIRRFRMAAWHGADHLMVIRTMGQSHFDGLIEGTPQGIGGVPISRKQVRAQRKALDLIEDEVGRKINYHSYVSGVAGPDVAVMFAEEGVNGAHQDPQYNVLYRNINMIRSFVDAAESKAILGWAGIAQIDGAHNANSTARDAWKVTPELLVQHGINSYFSTQAGIKPELICLSTVPPAAPPSPDLWLNLPYALALREFFSEYRMRAQQNTKYMTSSTREATVTHVLNLLISKLTGTAIQSTITPDEGRNVPWHIYNIEGIDTAKQTFAGLDGLMEMIEIKKDGYVQDKKRDIQERSILFLETLIEKGGYFKGIESGMFVDSGEFPDRNGDGISRAVNDGVGSGAIFERDALYMAPVTAHFGTNNVEQYDKAAAKDPAKLIGGGTFEDRSKIQYIDELDENDNVNVRLKEAEKYRDSSFVKPEVEWLADGTVQIDLMIPAEVRAAAAAAIEFGKGMNLEDVEVIHREVLHPSEGTRIQIKGKVQMDVDLSKLDIPEEPKMLSQDELFDIFQNNKVNVVCGTVGEDEHSVGLRETIDIKHGGIEKYGITYTYLGTSVPIEKFIDAAIETNSPVILVSAIISHDNIHYKNMKKIHEYAIEKGVRDKLTIIAGGPQITPKIAVEENGMDKAFARGTKGSHVATYIAEKLGLDK